MREREPKFKSLFDAWTWETKDESYHVRFTDGDEFILKGVFAGQDQTGPPHASASVDRVIHMVSGKQWDPEADIFFYLPDIAEVKTSSGELLFRAV
jgi:hypothetical protein